MEGHDSPPAGFTALGDANPAQLGDRDAATGLRPPRRAGRPGGADGSAPRRTPWRQLRAHPPALLARLTPTDRNVLLLYLATRLGVAIITYCVVWLLGGGSGQNSPSPFLAAWGQWDWAHLENIARYGYFANPDAFNPGHAENREAFFPGYPLAVRVVEAATGSYLLAGLLVSLLAGAVAVVALARLAGIGRPEATRVRAALFFLVSPCAVFLSAPYTEALFLAFALPAWLAARRGAWVRACVLAMGATATRVSGMFLLAAMLLMFLLDTADRRRWRSLPAFVLPMVPVLAFTAYLHAHTGDWLRWKHAEEQGWFRTATSPLDAFVHTWQAAFDHTQVAAYALEFQAELASMAVGVLLFLVLLLRRRWPEALYVGLNLWAFGTSYWYMSIDRASLLWWPLWIGLASWSVRDRRIGYGYLAVSVPLAVVWVVGFTSGHWMG